MTRLLPLSLLLLAPLALSAPARAAGSVTVRNGGTEPLTGISFNGGESRLRRPLPPGAEARIGYSTGCRADLRVTYGSGRTEDFPGVDPCTDPSITAGGIGGPAPAANDATSPRPARTAAGTAPPAPAKTPPPVVPPWTGKSITKRFGGLD